MKNLLSKLRQLPKRTLAIITSLFAVVAIPTALVAWGPDRPTYTIEKPADHVTFNSITNNPSHGDERNFVQVREANAGNETYADSISLTAGHEYVVYVYYHNNASSSLNGTNFNGTGVAHGAYVKADVPAVVTNNGNATAVGYIGADNATPNAVWDNISFSNTTGGDIALRFVPGSATIHNFGATNGATLSDNIVTTGATLGYNALDGIIPGCNEYAGYVTFRVKADQPNFTVSKQVRKNGTSAWTENIAVNPGDSVDFLITYKNTGSTTQNDVVISDVLPTGLSYTKDTTYLVNSTDPNGLKVSDNIVTTGGINIGNYKAGAAAYVKFTAKVAPSDALSCGENKLTNTASVRTNNGTKTDPAEVKITKTCPTPDEPSELPQTGATENILAVVGLGVIVTSLGYYITSRRQLAKM
jgi:uncharacterized repeat protein (TIGR01451 family)/LPXTG-motif cell wall-anchored protein